MLNLDTHILLRALTGELTRKENALLSRRTWSIASIALWEIAKLAELGRIEIDLEDPELNRILSRIHVWPITWPICRTIRKLRLRGDPADQIIAATSVVQRVPLVTRDRGIRACRAVPLAM